MKKISIILGIVTALFLQPHLWESVDRHASESCLIKGRTLDVRHAISIPWAVVGEILLEKTMKKSD